MHSYISNSKPLWLKIIVAVASIIVLFLILDRCGSILLGELNKQSHQRFSRLYRGGIDASILVLGNSRGVNGIYAPDVEKELDVPVVNMSYNGMSMEIVAALFDDYLRLNKKPDLLILEISNLGGGNGLINDLKLYTGESSKLAGLLKLIYPKTYWACQVTHLFRYNSEMFLRNLYYLNKDDQDWINRYTIKSEFVDSYVVPEGSTHIASSISDVDMQPLIKILERCKDEHVRVRLYVSPYLPKHIEQIVDFEEWKDFIREAVGPEYPLWDYSNAIRDNKFFADPVHMNINGNEELLPIMIEDGFFDCIISRDNRD